MRCHPASLFCLRFIFALENSKTSPSALCEWEAWEVILGAKIVLFLEITNFFEDFL